MPRIITSEEKTRRLLWSRFLGTLVGAGRPVSILKLKNRCAGILNTTGDGRGELYAYLKGTQTIGERKAFHIGSALHDLGITWCSGTTTLWASGHFDAFFRVLINLSKTPKSARAGAIIAAYTPWAVLSTKDAPLQELPAKIERAKNNYFTASQKLLTGLFVHPIANAYWRERLPAEGVISSLHTAYNDEAQKEHEDKKLIQLSDFLNHSRNLAASLMKTTANADLAYLSVLPLVQQWIASLDATATPTNASIVFDLGPYLQRRSVSAQPFNEPLDDWLIKAPPNGTYWDQPEPIHEPCIEP